MSRRHYCPNCAYPQSVCVCDALRQQECDYRVIALQHPSEVKHAKNTLRLLKLCIPDLQIWVGEVEDDFEPQLKSADLNPQTTAVIYPSEQSQALENHAQQWREQAIDTLVLIDSTWKKAYKIWQLNPWLQQLNGWHFASPPPSRYQIRKARVSHSLSTLEAVAYCLEQTKNTDCTPLYDAFEAMQKKQLQYR